MFCLNAPVWEAGCRRGPGNVSQRSRREWMGVQSRRTPQPTKIKATLYLRRWVRERRPFGRLFHPKCVTGNKMENVNTVNGSSESPEQHGAGWAPASAEPSGRTALLPHPSNPSCPAEANTDSLIFFHRYYFCPQGGKKSIKLEISKRCHFGELTQKMMLNLTKLSYFIEQIFGEQINLF